MESATAIKKVDKELAVSLHARNILSARLEFLSVSIHLRHFSVAALLSPPSAASATGMCKQSRGLLLSVIADVCSDCVCSAANKESGAYLSIVSIPGARPPARPPAAAARRRSAISNNVQSLQISPLLFRDISVRITSPAPPAQLVTSLRPQFNPSTNPIIW